MGVRKEIRSLSKTELDKLRAAFATLKKDKSNVGYQAIAGFHGCPEFRCPHHDLKFLPWHRIYILQIERGLQKIDKTISLPYWDWGSPESIAKGMPTAYTAKTSSSLLNSPINAAGKAPCQGVQSPTFRDPDDPGDLEQYRDQVAEAMKEKTFATFSSAIESPHDNIHVWVGGSMGAVISAAFDPIFWAHHCNIDRLWAAWQDNGGPDPKPPFVNTKLLPKFDITVKATLDYRKFKYTYAAGPTLALPKFNNFGLAELALPKPRTFLSVRVAELSAESFQLKVFINQPDADENTPTKGNPHFVGKIGIFGVGAPLEAHDHAAHDAMAGLATAEAETSKDLPPKEHKLDITDIASQLDTTNLQVKIVAIRLDGSPANANETPVAGVTVKRE